MTDYLIIDFQKGSAAKFFFNGLSYRLSPDEVTRLIEDGVLLKSEIGPPVSGGYGCHQCRRSFRIYGSSVPPSACPVCASEIWNTYTLLYCCECHALFEYYWHPLGGGHPYDRFPNCPACRSERWCPVENGRIKNLPTEEELKAQEQEAQARRQAEADAYTRLMQFRKQQQMKKLGLSSTSRIQPAEARNLSAQPEKVEPARSEKVEQEAQEKGAAMAEAEAFYKSREGAGPWLKKKEPAQGGFLSSFRRWFGNRRS